MVTIATLNPGHFFGIKSTDDVHYHWGTSLHNDIPHKLFDADELTSSPGKHEWDKYLEAKELDKKKNSWKTVFFQLGFSLPRLSHNGSKALIIKSCLVGDTASSLQAPF